LCSAIRMRCSRYGFGWFNATAPTLTHRVVTWNLASASLAVSTLRVHRRPCAGRLCRQSLRCTGRKPLAASERPCQTDRIGHLSMFAVPRRRWVPCVLLVALGLVISSCAVHRELSRVEPIGFNTGVIAGFVTDSVTQRPVVGAALVLLTPDGDSITDQQATAFSLAPDGGYRFGTVRPGTYLLRASADAYRPATITIHRINAGERNEVSFRLQRQ
jgi:hypothetical protein